MGGVSKAVVYVKSRRLETHVGTMNLGKGLHFVHAGGIRLNADRIGNNFTVYQGVTLRSGKGKGVPIIEGNVTCYTNSVVSGNIVVGAGSKIGATAFINHSIAPESLVINQCIIKTKEIGNDD